MTDSHIRIDALPPRIQYAGDGVQTAFTFPFPVFLPEDIQVYLQGTLQTSGYLVSGAGDDDGGNIVFDVPPAADTRITITRRLRLARMTDFQEGGEFRAATLNDELDYQIAAIQQIDVDLARAIRLAPTDEDTDMVLPASAGRAGKLAGFDGSGKLMVYEPASALPDDASASYVTPTGLPMPRQLRDRFASLPTARDSGATGDGTTDDGAALKALVTEVALPEGDYAVSTADWPLIDPTRISGPGIIVEEMPETVLRTRRDGFGRRGLGRSFATLGALLPDLTGGTANIERLMSAIASGSVTVVFAGDSITEGVFDVHPVNAWRSLMAESLRRAFPWVTWTFIDYSLGARTIHNLASDTYAALASEPGDVSTGFYRPAKTDFHEWSWPAGSTLSKTWRDHVRDAAPDLLIVAHGMNSADPNTAAFETSLQDFLDYAAGWATRPTVAITTTFLPTRLTAPYNDSRQANIDAHCRMMRIVAGNRRHMLIDANRVYHWLRDGIDEGRRFWFQEADWRGFDTDWWDYLEGSASDVTLAAGRLGFGGTARVRRLSKAADFEMDLTWKPAHASNVLGVNYRVDPDASAERYEFQWSGDRFVFYWKTTQILNVAGVLPSVGVDNHIKIRVEGARHQVWFNGALAGEVEDFNSLKEGYPAFIGYRGGGGTPEIGVSLRLGYPQRIGPPLLHEPDLVGDAGVNDILTNPDSAGGNTLNHPSTSGHHLIYGPAIAAAVDAIRPRPGGPWSVLTDGADGSVEITLTAAAFTDTGDSVTVVASGGETALVSFLFHVENKSPVTGGSICRVAHNGATLDNTVQYFPATSFRGEVVSVADIPATLVAGSNEFKLQWMSESGSHTIRSRTPGRRLTVKVVG